MEVLSTRERMTQVLEVLSVQQNFVPFVSLFRLNEGRMGVIVTFMAVMELIKESLIDIVQNRAFWFYSRKSEIRIMEQQQVKNIIEGALLAYDQALSVDKLQSLFFNEHASDDEPNKEQFIPSRTEITDLLHSLQEDFVGRGYELKQVASGWRLQVREELAPWVNRLWKKSRNVILVLC